ncbi:adenylate/guanylate cyclase domain-containing protein [Leptospira interrogans]|uniref:Adenylate/guanylate cyclase n=11 Tax=Leptospira interrogans TaxID=173 RepID=Q8F7F2_LEPIN|nr:MULTISPECIES: adenylate/guanylate cyclase domain-containing protein [Leptospira]EMF43124.1 adenylate/guanylate cyclase catalytic domain protein [Leptospira interrogans serovar Lora str. TE 1992]EMG12469.1 adenylate/guanylate cyclase catalytic domain protein [Leptospira interrogans serovar Grippotyphosa str. LT2186]EMP04895.1 adenylate/guanylate cyclase catalytic domain protein [Leptospira interrogans serovar Pyrogenes str. 200701872]EMY23707.1 adenylate/guanylate cyclase catalytic domain pro
MTEDKTFLFCSRLKEGGMLDRWKDKNDKSVRWEELPNLHSDLQDLDLIIRSLISEKLSLGIREIIFCLSAEQALSLKKSRDFLKLIKDLKRAGFTISSADKDKILSTNVESSSKFFRYLENRSRNVNCLVWTEDLALSQIESKYYDFLNHFHGYKFESFRPSRFTIRVKLLSIVSAIITLSMGLMITMATYFFRKYSEILIQEYNLSLARMTGIQLSGQLKETTRKIQDFRSEDSEKFFRTNSNAVAYVRFKNKTVNSALEIDSLFWNSKFLKSNSVVPDPTNLKNALEKSFSRLSGTLEVLNVSNEFGFPAVAVLLPVGVEISGLVFSASEFLGSFLSVRQTDFFQMIVVDSSGNLIAHSNDKEAVSGKDYKKHPLVENMLRSPSDNGSQRFDFEGREVLGSYQQLEVGGLGIISTLDADIAFEAVYKIRRQNFWIMISVLSVAFFVVFVFSRTLTIPIIQLLSATKKVEQGNYAVDIRATTHDEVGVLTNSFLRMARGLEEREKIKNTFGKFVNKEIAERALSSDLKLGGENREVTVFFSDLRNFTGMSEKMKPEEVVEFLNQYFTEMVECIYLTQGIVDKFIGDAVMAHWGALVYDGNEAKNSINAALLMRRALIEFNLKGKEIGRPFTRFGCGINSGPVIVGQIGSEKKLEFTVIGDTVNLASRIEYLNKEFGTDILISESTYQQAKDHFNFVELPPVWIRGKEKPQVVYAVLGWKDDQDCPKSLEELRTLCGIPDPENPSRSLA